MINSYSKQIAEKIQTALNTIAKQYTETNGVPLHTYNLDTVVGMFEVAKKPTPRTQGTEAKTVVNGILTEVPSIIEPLGDNAFQVYTLSYILRLTPTREIAEAVCEEYKALAKEINNKAFTVQDIQGDTTTVLIPQFALPNVGGITRGGTDGREVIITATITCQAVKKGITSDEAYFSIDGQAVPILQSGVARANVLQTDAIANTSEMQSTENSSFVNFSFTLAYFKSDTVASIVKEILHHEFGKIHTLKYNDEYLAELYPSEVFEYIVVLKDGTLNIEQGKIASITCTFAPVNQISF